jgi:hypothetical protein
LPLEESPAIGGRNVSCSIIESIRSNLGSRELQRRRHSPPLPRRASHPVHQPPPRAPLKPQPRRLGVKLKSMLLPFSPNWLARKRRSLIGDIRSSTS